MIGTKCYGTEKTFTGYTCPSGYTLDGSTCFKKNTTTVAATKKTNKVTGYNCRALEIVTDADKFVQL